MARRTVSRENGNGDVDGRSERGGAILVAMMGRRAARR